MAALGRAAATMKMAVQQDNTAGQDGDGRVRKQHEGDGEQSDRFQRKRQQSKGSKPKHQIKARQELERMVIQAGEQREEKGIR